MSTVDIEYTLPMPFPRTTASPYNYISIEIPKGEEPKLKCDCTCHKKSILSEILDWLSYKKNIYIKCLECRCFG